MSFSKCIPGYVPRSQRQQLEDEAEQWARWHKGDRGKGEVSAAREAIRRSVEKQRQIALTAEANAKMAASLEGKTGKAAADAFEARAVTSTKGVGADDLSAEAHQHVVSDVAAMHANDFRSLGADTPRAEVDAVSAGVMRELAGVDTGDQRFKAAAASLRKSLDYLKGEFNRLGGAIKTRGNYLLPQTWDAAKVIEAGRDAFVERLAKRYETDGVMDPLLGPHGAPMDGDELRGALAGIHDRIVRGDDGATIGIMHGAMKDRHLDPRAISYRDVNARIEDAQAFGNPNIFEVVDSHTRTMSREAGAMRAYGPHPDLTFANGRELAASKGAPASRLASVDRTYRKLTGALDRPASAGWAQAGEVVRAVMSGGLLPLSLVSQLSDVVPVSLASSIFGIPAMRAVTNGLRQVAGAGLSHAELARIGVVIDGVLAHLQNSGALDATGRVHRFNEAAMRFYGIKRWAEGMQAGQELTMLGHLADLSGKTLAEADAAMNGNLSKLGWTDATWDTVRNHGILESGGSKYASINALEASGLSPAEIAAAQTQLVYTSKRFANLGMTVPDVKTRGMMAMGGQRGTPLGEAALSATQFKSFGTQFFLTQVGQIMQLEGRVAKVAYTAKLLAATTALGLVSFQIKRLLKGQGLAEMDPTTDEGRRAIFSGMMQGGGFGIVADPIVSATQESRFGHGLVTSIAGPTFGALEDVAALTLGNVGQAARGEQTKFASEAIKLGAKYTPFANAPFLGLAYQRLMVDQARLWADPSGTRRSFMTTAQKQREDYGAKNWWANGQTLPEGLR